jgi:multidrug efflux system outer membrane protein
MLPEPRVLLRGAPLALLLLAACAGEPPRRDDAVDELVDGFTYQAPLPADAAVAAEGPWWADFGDAGMDATIQAVLANNYDLQEAAARVRSAAAVAEAVAGASLPQLGAGLQSRRNRSVIVGLPIPGAPSPFATTATQHDLGLDLSWEVDLWGRLDADERAAVADLESAAAGLDGARLSLSGLAAKAWLGVVEAQRQEALAAAQVANAEDLLAHLRRAYAQGGPSTPIPAAESALAGARTGLENARRTTAVRERGLATLLGSASTARADFLPDVAVELPALPVAVPVGLPADLLARRPDLKQAEAALRAADARSASARRALYPSLTLTASGGTSSDALGDLLDGDFSVWSLAGGLTAPLFQGGRLRANLAANEASAEAASWAFARGVLGALIEVESALVVEAALRAQHGRLGEQRAADERRVAQAERLYRTGVGPAADIFTLRSELLRTASQELGLALLLLDNRIDLHLALGGNFTPSQP